MKDTKFGLQVGIGAAGRAVGALVAFAGSIFLARAIGDVAYGVFYFILTISAILDNPVTGWAVGCRKRLTEADFNASRAAGAALLGAAVGAGTLLIVVVLIRQPIRRFIGADSLLLWVAFTGVIFNTSSMEVLKGTRRFGGVPWINAGRDVIRVLLQVAFVFLIADVAGMVLGITLANLLLLPLVFRLADIRPTVPTRAELRSIWGFAKSSIPNGFVSTTMFRMDILLLGTLAGALFVGNYRVGMNLTMPAMFVAGMMGAGAMSTVSNRLSRGEDPGAHIEDMLSYTSVLGVPIAAGALAMGDVIAVTAYGSQYSEAGLFIGALGVYRLVQTQVQVMTSVLSGMDRPDLNLRLNAVGLVTNVLLGIGLFYLIGPFGIAAATVVSITIRYGIAAYWVRRRAQVGLWPAPLKEQVLAGAVMGAVVLAIRTGVGFGSWIGVVGTVGIGAMVYGGLLMLISESFRETVTAIARDAVEAV